MRGLFRFLLGLAACAVLFYSGTNLLAYIRESSQSASLNAKLVEGAVVVKDPKTHSDPPDFFSMLFPAGEPDPTEEPIPEETVPISVDFDYLTDNNPDVVGWLYSENTPINLPLAQAKDNDYYLRRMLDGSWNAAGTLFLDYRNAGNFSDGNTVIYGHNMKDKSMFAELLNYKDQTYFEEHPIMWLLTPEGNYQVELVAGYVTSASARIYSIGLPEEDLFALVEKAVSQSTFISDFQLSRTDRFVTLSTCSYEYDDARYVVLGRLVPLDEK